MIAFRQFLKDAVQRPDSRAFLVALVAVFVLVPVWWLSGRWYEARLSDQERAEAALETSLRGNALSSVINRRVARLQGLYAFVQAELSEEDFATLFEKFAAGLYAGTRGIRNLAVAPSGVVRYVYPLAGNEAVLGYEPSQDTRPEVQADVERAIETRMVVMSGPVGLVQGGEGLIARQAVYHGEQYWGLVNIVLDMPLMLDEAELGEQLGKLRFALRDSRGRIFYGSEDVFESAPVITLVELPEEVWELAGAPPEGWQATVRGPLLVFRVAGLIIVGLLASLAYLSVNRQARLAEAVQQRTREIAQVNVQLQQDIAERRRAEEALSEREAQYRSIFESTSDGLLVVDLEGLLVDFNPAAAQMHGYTIEEFRYLQPRQFVHPDSWPLFVEFLDRVKAGDRFRRRVLDRHKDGTVFHIEVLGRGFIYRGQPHALAVIRDISEEIRAYQLLEHRVEERTRELSTLLDVSTHIASTLELEPLLDVILEQLQQVVEYDGANVLILEGDELCSVAHRGPVPEESREPLHFSREQAGELWEAMEGDQPLIIDDVRGDSWLAEAFRHAVGVHLDHELSYVRSWVGVPLFAQERLIGWLSLHNSEPDAYRRHHATLAQTIANQAATAIENARLYEQARRLAVLEERQRLARELHDSVSQALYGIGLGARTARTLLDRLPSTDQMKAAMAEPLDYVLSLVDAGLTEMRALIFELRPDALEKEGLVAALSHRSAALQSRNRLKVYTEFCEEPELPFETKEALYRIAQEALNNTIKHAQADEVKIRLYAVGGIITLEVWDNGIGFDAQADYPGHMGLQSMRERAGALGGTLEIESAIGQGTRVRVRVPVA